MNLGHPANHAIAGDIAGIMSQGFVESTAALCLCDDADLIRYANPSFRAAFFPSYDGSPADFMDTIVAAMRAGTGLRISSASPEEFAASSRRRRRALVGSHSFSADFMDGGWWSVTDTKLPNGWILIVGQDISALKNEEARLRDAHDTALAESQTDFLTGIASRRHGLQRAEQLWHSARAARIPISVALFDIDHFKAINDTYGHGEGDRALVHFAQTMAASMSPEDNFSRLGGDEFLMVRSRCDRQAFARSLARTLRSLPPLAIQGGTKHVRLSVSVGVAEACEDDTWPGLMHRADVALYDAKAGGRNRIEAAAPSVATTRLRGAPAGRHDLQRRRGRGVGPTGDPLERDPIPVGIVKGSPPPRGRA